jgi:hypothetical protein
VPKGELKRGLASLDPALFDAAFEALAADATLGMRGERVRPGGAPWTPPTETMAALEQLERDLEAAGYLVPENAAWQVRPGAAEVMALGLFLERLVRVNQELTYTTKQLTVLREKLAAHFEQKPALTVADFRDLTGASRKYAVPLLEHSDRVGWTVRVGDERKRGGKIT